MKKFILLLIFISSIGNINAQNEQKKNIPVQCSVTSNFNYLNPDCNTVHFTANASSSLSTDILGYYWDFGDGQTSNIQNPIHNYSNNGNYTVTLTVVGYNSINGNCCNDTSIKTISINCGPLCGVLINTIDELNVSGDNNVLFYSQLQLNPGWTITSSVFTLTYQNNSTSTHNGVINTLGNPQVITPVYCTNKVIKVKLTVYVSNASGYICSHTKTQNFLGVCGTGFSKVNPNPVKDILNINIDSSSFKNNAKIKVALYNTFGTLEKTKIISKELNSIHIDVSQLKKGIYILKTYNNNKLINSQKVVIMH